MNRRLCLILAAAASPSAAWAHDDSRPTLSDPDNRPILLTRDVDPGAAQALRQSTPQVSPLLFLNRCPGGCQVSAGDNDARTNSSTIPDEDAELSEFEHSDAVWDATVACVREVFEPYGVEVVTENPGGQSHHAAVVAGTADELGIELPPDTQGEIGGVAPLANDCRPLDNVMSFTFANTLQDNPIDLCWTIAHEAGHAYGLEHVNACADPMTYLPGCGTKYFRDEELPCGEFEERDCQCGGTTQNSHAHLTRVLGEGTPPEPPEVQILNLEADTEVADGEPVTFEARHPRGISRVTLEVNGTEYQERSGNDFDEGDSYQITLPQHPDGVLEIEAVAYNDLGIAGSDEVTVQKGEPCTSHEQCFAGMECDDGACRFPEPFLEAGEPCEHDRECVSGLCPAAGDERYCSERCDLRASADGCPSGLECVEADDNELGACWPEGALGGCGGCAAGRGGASFPTLVLSLALLCAYGLGRRRRQRTAERGAPAGARGA